MNQLTATLYPERYKPEFVVKSTFTHKAIPADALGKKVTKGTPESKAAYVEQTMKFIEEGIDRIVPLSAELGVSVSSANAYVDALMEQKRVYKTRLERGNGVVIRSMGHSQG